MITSLQQQFIHASHSLTQKADLYTVGHIPPAILDSGMPDGYEYRPRQPLPPDDCPQPVFFAPHTFPLLFQMGAADLDRRGIDPNKCYLYLMYHSALVPPNQALREPQWHFDLLRMLRACRDNVIPLIHSYSVSSALPTQFLTQVYNQTGGPLPAYDTVRDTERHQKLGHSSLAQGFGFVPEPGDVVHSTNLVLHRGQVNQSDTPVFRTFIHMAFSPIDPDRPVSRELARGRIPSPL